MVSAEVQAELDKIRQSVTAVATSFDDRSNKLQQGLEAAWTQRLAEITRAQQQAIAAVQAAMVAAVQEAVRSGGAGGGGGGEGDGWYSDGHGGGKGGSRKPRSYLPLKSTQPEVFGGELADYLEWREDVASYAGSVSAGMTTVLRWIWGLRQDHVTSCKEVVGGEGLRKVDWRGMAAQAELDEEIKLEQD